MGRIAGILFDKDGTLFDFAKTWGSWAQEFLTELALGDVAVAAQMGEAIGFDFADGKFRRSSPFITHTVSELAERLLPFLPGASPSTLINRMNVSAAQAPLVEAAPLHKVLGELQAKGLRMGVASNDSEVVTKAHLKRAGVCDFLDFLAGFDSGHGAKPQPGQLLAFAAAMEIPPERVVMVGDSRHDMLAGRAAGMVTVAVLSGLATSDELMPLADLVLEDIGELPAWLDTVELPSIAAA